MSADTLTSPVDILLVEDDPGDEMMAREAFGDDAMATVLHVVSDGEQALDFVHRRGAYHSAPRPAFILLDLNLPRMDGREVLANLKAHESTASIPVVVLTTSRSQDDVIRCYRLHSNAYVTKPTDYDNFIDVVRSINQFWSDTALLPDRTPPGF
ncbi:response regulator [Rugosimonospora acidiphila]|uniref:Response regulator n=1 Tax=Rugosimonospora acidiphila TaxID=556531 RepID=A0ABP9RJJ3_9ACTN